MSTVTFRTICKTLVLFALYSMFSINAKAGGDVYQIYLNNNLLFKQYVIEPFNLKNVKLDNVKAGDELVVHYSHCGAVGKGRRISIKDGSGNTLKEWKFSDAVGSNAGMRINAKELQELQSKNADLYFHYSSQELPKGRTLAMLSKTSKNVSFKKDFNHSSFVIPFS